MGAGKRDDALINVLNKCKKVNNITQDCVLYGWSVRQYTRTCQGLVCIWSARLVNLSHADIIWWTVLFTRIKTEQVRVGYSSGTLSGVGHSSRT